MNNKAKLVAEKLLKGQLYNKAVLPKHYSVALRQNIKHHWPAKGLKVIGVTGTNGKTSTCFMIHRMLVEAGYKAGLMSTVAFGVGNDIEPQIHHMTSQPIDLLLSRIEKMKNQGMDILVLEVTSHALAQYRVMGVPIDIAVMTNLTHEHLDYHGSFAAYRSAKLKLFKMAAHTKNGRQLGVINADDPSAAVFADAVPNVLAYSLNGTSDQAIAWPKDLKLTPKGSRYQTEIKGWRLDITCNLPGSFNVANSLAAACVGIAFGLTPKQVEQGIKSLKSVEGRMTRIDEGQNFDVIVDFAHTPDSFEKLFNDLRPVVKGKLISLFGSAGRRDVSKRAIQGKIAGASSDIVIVTEEDDRDVDGNQIMNQIASGAEESGKTIDKDLFLILDRTKAIEFALKQAKPGDTVLLLGKGHEKTIERATGEHPWDEIKLARRFLKSL
ncbi:MAG: UDP-N-acetylmuramoyl-L-alanyl-D-glutamate--2,6-diaminopimelate ligase [bacterium]|nr:UDP-N-acetylmuramoyl-L-alanyl-D-glutamate--2,6-diaminopimelate ligase [bacterium]